MLLVDLLRQLEASIEANSRQYKQPVASLVFQLNNLNYLLIGIKSLDPSLIDPSIEQHLADSVGSLIKSSLTQYARCWLSYRWKALAMRLSADPIEAPKTFNMPSRDKLKYFQSAFEEASDLQKSLSIADAELLRSLRMQIREIVLPVFVSFYN